MALSLERGKVVALVLLLATLAGGEESKVHILTVPNQGEEKFEFVSFLFEKSFGKWQTTPLR